MTEAEPPGCLAALFRLIGIELRKAEPLASGQLPYRLRYDFLSSAELSFYHVLQLAVKDRAQILAKVNLADMFFVADSSQRNSYRNKIDRKHVDFLLCDPATLRPRCGIELDDSSHDRRDRQERDQFVDQVFVAAGLPLVRFPVQASYDPQAIAARLDQHLGESVAIAVKPFGREHSGSPTCPKCNVPMVQRTATKGKQAGQQFWGCANYPKCREIR